MSHRWWALIALAMFACGGPPETGPAIVYSPCAPVHLAPEADTTDAERESIVSAVAMWSQVGVTALTMNGSPEGAVPLRFKHAAAVFHGVYEPSSGLVSINRGLSGTEREVTVAHELGHAIGLPHVERSARASVMNPGNLTVLPTSEDVGELQRLWGCPL